MKIEFVEFYPYASKRENVIHGSLHLYIIDWKLDIRGVYVRIIDKRFWFRLPHLSSIDAQTGNYVGFPVISFDAKDREIFFKILKTEGKKFVKDRLKSGELIFPIQHFKGVSESPQEMSQKE